LLVFLMEFITEYKQPMSEKKVRSIKLIAKNYIKTEFFIDVLMLIPWNWIVHFNGSHYLFVIKVLRLREAFDILDVKKFYSQLKGIFNIRRAKIL